MLSLSSVKRFIKRFEKYGHVRPTVQVRMQGKLTRRMRKRLAKQVEEHPDYTLAQHAQLWHEKYQRQVGEWG
jgi:transposase